MRTIAFIGPGEDATPHNVALAERLAEAVVRTLGVAVVTGGLNGVMAAAAKGAVRAGGIALGVIPGDVPGGASVPHTLTIATGMGEARNAIVVNTAEVVVAIGRSWGTLSEVALARRAGRRVIQLDGEALAEDGLTNWILADADPDTADITPIIDQLAAILAERGE